MKKEKRNKVNLQYTWNNLVDEVIDFPNRVKTIIKEINEEFDKNQFHLTCLKNATMDFNFVEADIIRIHQNLEMENRRVLGSHLILDDRHNLMEIQTYTEKEGKTYRIVNSAQVQKLKNVPDEVQHELNKNKRVELSFTLD